MYKSDWMREYKKAHDVLNIEPEWVLKDYIVFRIRGGDYTLVGYPHKTTAGNYHLRIRDENSKNKYKAVLAMKKLDESTIGCTFSVKKWPKVEGYQIELNK